MSSRFHAIFGVCRRKGGTKKACYNKAIAKVEKRRPSSSRSTRRSSGRGRCCKRMGYSQKAGRKVCREYR